MSAAKPMDDVFTRASNYFRQNGATRLTPRQLRRLNHKELRAYGRLESAMGGAR